MSAYLLDEYDIEFQRDHSENMPEGPELHLTMLSINKLCKDVIFSGKVVRNPIHRCAEVTWDQEMYTIRAESRGKELLLHLQEVPGSGDSTSVTDRVPRSMSILFTFGMSGKFAFTPAQELLKHSHLSFITKKAPQMAVSFVDARRFGKWVEGGTWSIDRGPCVIQDYDNFVKNILANLQHPAFKRPICEVMLDQQFFNGIGNYLRAEILYRCQVPPFVAANSVLQLQDGGTQTSQYFKEEGSNNLTFGMLTPKAQELLQLCHTVPLEVVHLGCSKYTLLDLTADDDDGLFANWMQCYNQAGMKSLADHKKRTIWFIGAAGPLAPTEPQSRKAKTWKKAAPASKVKAEVNQVPDSGKQQLPGEMLDDHLLLDSTDSSKPKRSKPAGRRTNHSSSLSTAASQSVENHSAQMSSSTARKPAHKKRVKAEADVKIDRHVKVAKNVKLTDLEKGSAVLTTRVTRSTCKMIV